MKKNREKKTEEYTKHVRVHTAFFFYLYFVLLEYDERKKYGEKQNGNKQKPNEMQDE